MRQIAKVRKKGGGRVRREGRVCCILLGGRFLCSDEMELISRSVQRGGPVGQQLEERYPVGAGGEGVSSDSSRPLPSGYCGVRAPSAGPGCALG